MPSYMIHTLAPSGGLSVVDITHDDGTFRGSVGFYLYYEDVADLKAQLARVVQENQDTHYAIKERAAAQKDVEVLAGKSYAVAADGTVTEIIGK